MDSQCREREEEREKERGQGEGERRRHLTSLRVVTAFSISTRLGGWRARERICFGSPRSSFLVFKTGCSILRRCTRNKPIPQYTETESETFNQDSLIVTVSLCYCSKWNGHLLFLLASQAQCTEDSTSYITLSWWVDSTVLLPRVQPSPCVASELLLRPT